MSAFTTILGEKRTSRCQVSVVRFYHHIGCPNRAWRVAVTTPLAHHASEQCQCHVAGDPSTKGVGGRRAKEIALIASHIEDCDSMSELSRLLAIDGTTRWQVGKPRSVP
jgi:hypothetical protein